MAKRIVSGILAHVDAGKTTLLEALLYESGTVRSPGSVDRKNSNLDTWTQEKDRGITIFSKQTVLNFGGVEFSFLDTPGPVDLSAETERTLAVLDACVLVIDATAGIKEHTRTLWKLLERHRIPVFLFVNKMDRRDADKEAVLALIRRTLSRDCVDFSEDRDPEAWTEAAASCREDLLEAYLEGTLDADPDGGFGPFGAETLSELIADRLLFPVFFGSALKITGVRYFAETMAALVRPPVYGKEFGARVYKISRDPAGTRLAWLKVTGGTLTAKMRVGDDKVEQIRVYAGTKYETLPQMEAGGVCAVCGLAGVRAGDCLGAEAGGDGAILTPAIRCDLILPEGTDAPRMMEDLMILAEEEPMLAPEWVEETGSIRVSFMGQIQTEVVASLIEERFGVKVGFGPGKIIYRETISEPVLGAGHFEPLRHYAEVRLLIEPMPAGAGLSFESRLSTDVLAGHWQRLILGQLASARLKGVLTRSEFTDAKIVLVGGKAHPKHTEGGDFGQAARRAFRQALMKAAAKNCAVLLEPWYDFRVELPQTNVGRALNDLQNMGARFEGPEIEGPAGRAAPGDGAHAEELTAVITGSGPAAGLGNYQQELTAYSGGRGRIDCVPAGFAPCADAEAVIAERGYDPESDRRNPADSVFCTHGSGYTVPWWEADEKMHTPEPRILVDGSVETPGNDVENRSIPVENPGTAVENAAPAKNSYDAGRALDAELEAIFRRTYGSKSGSGNSPDGAGGGKSGSIRSTSYGSVTYGRMGAGDSLDVRAAQAKTNTKASVEALRAGTGGAPARKEYLLVDGYNVIFAWDELAELAQTNVDAARMRLAEELANYRGFRGCSVILVFDAYRVKGHQTEYVRWHGIDIVYTKEAETADQYIEKTAHDMSKKYAVTVATSDRLEQMIIFGEGASRLSSRELQAEIARAKGRIRERIEEERGPDPKRRLLDGAELADTDTEES